ncbi:NUDIX domain-containing protein [Streptomyces bambusae]|uniref:NUDIX domain-containing protein n=1 Tax=Streptomyces bambusae TaxID=1550616 RepID=A0ABS6YZS5_9ACTN|nr:NUDIX hydrolase [Streptomyces bambusae]MBW5480985.1 NUDIX domain-containing protein [Streptomyces bambusae]
MTPSEEGRVGGPDAEHPPGEGSGWRHLDTRLLHQGDFLTLCQDRVVRPDGAAGTYDHVVTADAARVVALDGDGRIALVEDGFYLLGRRVLHLPGGGIEAGEPPEEAARRECAEEIGRRPGHVQLLTVLHPLPGSTAAATHVFLATGLTPDRRAARDATEAAMTVHWTPVEEAVQAAVSGRITEAGSVVGLLLAARLLPGAP